MWGTLVGKGPVESSSKPLPDVHKDLDKCPHRLIHASYIKGGERRYSPIYLTSKSTNSFLPLVIPLLVIHLHSQYGFNTGRSHAAAQTGWFYSGISGSQHYSRTGSSSTCNAQGPPCPAPSAHSPPSTPLHQTCEIGVPFSLEEPTTLI